MLVWDEIVAVVIVDRVDFLSVYELKDLDHPSRL